MALDKTALKTEIKTILDDLKKSTDQPSAIDAFATKLSDAIDNYVKTGTVVGTDSQGGPITGTIE